MPSTKLQQKLRCLTSTVAMFAIVSAGLLFFAIEPAFAELGALTPTRMPTILFRATRSSCRWVLQKQPPIKRCWYARRP